MLDGPAGALHLSAARALQGARPHHLRTAGGAPDKTWQYKNDVSTVYVYTLNASGAPSDPGFLLYASGEITIEKLSNADLIAPGTIRGRWMKGDVSWVNIVGAYFNSTGDYVGTWECFYNGGDFSDPYRSGPLLKARITPNSMTFSKSVALNCSVYNYDWVDGDFVRVPVPVPCNGGQLLPSTAHCIPSKGSSVIDYRHRCMTSDQIYNSRQHFNGAGGGCLADESASTPAMVTVDCGRQYILTAYSLSFLSATVQVLGQAKPVKHYRCS
jgi:hypothetical protein